MSKLSLLEWSAIAQIILTIITGFGIILSLYYSRRALQEVNTDRLIRQKPYLAFEGGGHRLSIEFVKAGKSIPGMNPEYVYQIFSNIPEDAESVRIKDIVKEDGDIEIIFYAHLSNFGLDPALEARVTWIPEKVIIGSETFEIDAKKKNEPLYHRDLNCMPLIPEHISPGGLAQLSRLPTFIDKDFEKKIAEVEGTLEIECEDIFGNTHLTKQGFWIGTEYKDGNPYIHITFLEVRFSE